MNLRVLLLLPVIGATTFFILLFAFTRLFGPIPFSVNSVTTQKSTTFDVTAEGKVTVKPDVAFVSAGIKAQAQTVKGVQDQINSVINNVSQAVKDLGVDSKDIQTISYNINPDYDYSSSPAKIKGYSAHTTLSIKVREIDKINGVIDAATVSGANEVSGVRFDVDDKAKAQNEAREKAVAEAKKKAQDAAKIAVFKLGRIVNYYETDYGSSVPYSASNIRTFDIAAEKTTQVEPGTSEVRLTVTISYEIY